MESGRSPRGALAGFCRGGLFGTKPAEEGIERCGPPLGGGFGPPGSLRVGNYIYLNEPVLWNRTAACGGRKRRQGAAGLRHGEAAARGLLQSPIHWKTSDSCRGKGRLRPARLKESEFAGDECEKEPLRRLGGARLRREPPKRARLKPCGGGAFRMAPGAASTIGENQIRRQLY